MKKIIIAFLLLISRFTNAADYYIAADAANGGDGSIGSPWNELSDITGLIAGDNVYLQRGDTFNKLIAKTATQWPMYFQQWNTTDPVGEVSGRRRIGNQIRSQCIHVGHIMPQPLNILQSRPAAQHVVGHVQNMIGLMIW